MTDHASREARIAQIDQMIRAIGWQVQKRSTHTLARPDIDLTLPQMVTLFAIHDSGTCRMSTLADMTQQSAGTLTGIVDRLIDDGLVARVRNTTDRRVVEVTLTPQGKTRLDQVVRTRYEDMNRILTNFGDEDLQTLDRLLLQFLHGIQGDDGHDSHLSRAVEA